MKAIEQYLSTLPTTSVQGRSQKKIMTEAMSMAKIVTEAMPMVKFSS